MRVKKTRQSDRGVYRYPVNVEDGRGGWRTSYNVVKPGDDGVTEITIKALHSMDDAEVYNNTKNGHPPMTAEQKEAKKEWEESHPGEKYQMNWNLSLDYIAGEDSDTDDLDKSQALAGAFYDPFAESEVSDDVQRLRDIAANLTEKQRQVYQLVLIEGYGYTDAAKLMGCSPANVKQISNRIIEIIKEKF